MSPPVILPRIATLCLVLAAVGFAATPASVAQKRKVDPLAKAPKALTTILAKDLEAHATKLASDEFGGRLTGTEDQRKTAEYVAEHFDQLGLAPAGERGAKGKKTFFQGFKVTLNKLESDGTGLFDGEGQRLHEFGGWFLPGRAKKAKAKGKLVFVGEARDEDLDGKNLAGTIPVVLLKLPEFRGGNVMQAMGEGFRLAAIVRGKTRRLKQRGAKGSVFVAREFSASFLSVMNMAGVYPGKPKVSLGWKKRSRSGRMGMFGGAAASIPTLVVSEEDAKQILMRLGQLPKLVYAGQGEVGTKSEDGYVLGVDPSVEQTKANNVIAVLEGRDGRLKKEAVVYSCHMDHLGRTADGGAFNGADDNASGTSTVLEIAEAYAKLPRHKRPKRSILFVVVAGEELGLWGSEHFANDPTWPLDKIVADINMDMLGRSTQRVPDDVVALTPTYRINAYSTLAREAVELGEAFGLRMGNGDRFYTRSDHYNFAKRGVPVVFFCDDEHVDYHMPSDTSDKLEYDKMERIGRLAFMIGYRTGDRKKRPKKLGKRNDWFSEDK